jgi:aminoglycoside phosphotransferase family enzyme/predicted kinase
MVTRAATIEPLDPSIPESLSAAGAFSDPVSVVQTHLSHVFLTHDRVFKLHKDVDLGFVSFATQRERNLDCLRELSLNRRLAPDVYLGIAPIERKRGRWVVGETRSDPADLESGEHCVVMRRLPDGRDALSLLNAGLLEWDAIERLAGKLARFHQEQSLGRPSPYSQSEWRDRIAGSAEANFASLLERAPDVVPRSEILELRDLSRETWARIQPAIDGRRLAGKAVEGHGDLHLDHVWFETDDAGPLVIDSITFSEELRCIDSASDIAFLAMDLGSRGRPDLGEHLLATYALASDDYDLYEVIDFFIGYRAAVRAKVAALEMTDDRIAARQRQGARNRAQRRVDFARRVLMPRAPARVYLVGGIIGGGKSTAARTLARATGAVVVSSDEVRRFAPEDASEGGAGGWPEARYSRAARARVYDAMLEGAASVVASGRDVVLDASWSTRETREQARAWASAHASHPVFIEIRCDRAVALARLEARQHQANDASEAGPVLYDDFAGSFENPDEWPTQDLVVIATDLPDWRERLIEAFPRASPALQALSVPE